MKKGVPRRPSLLRVLRIVASVVLVAGALATPSGCSESRHEGGERVGTAAQPIYWGTQDSSVSPQFPYVVALTRANATAPFCTGILIARQWVLTAAHCVYAPGMTPLSDIDAVFAVNPFSIASDNTQFRYPHTNAKSGPILVRTVNPAPNSYDEDAAADIAVFRLDRPVPPSLARPLHPSLVPEVCGENFDGVLVGHGTKVDFPGGQTCEVGGGGGLRRYTYIDDWSRNVIGGHGFVYEHTSVLSFFVCVDYQGAENGDSGGPIIDVDTGSLCGVSSWIGNYGTVWTQHYAAVDSGETIDWLRTVKILDGGLAHGHGPVDARGYWEGSCPAYDNACALGSCLLGYDSDVDGVFDVCDDCPTVYNPEQEITNDDFDGNGRGWICDHCPGHAYDLQLDNCAYEAQLALAYPGRSEPPTIDWSNPDLEAERYHYKFAFFPDACNESPCPDQDWDAGAGWLGPEHVPDIVDSPDPDWNCNNPVVGNACWWYVDNAIVLSPRSTPVSAQGGWGRVGQRWCPCPEQLSTTLAGRVACQMNHGCAVDANLYQPKAGNAWLEIITNLFQDSAGNELGAEWALPLGTHNDYRVWWDFQSLSQSGLNFTHVQYAPGGGVSAMWVEGVLWAAVRDVNGSLPAHTKMYAHTYQAGNPRMQITSGEQSFVVAATDRWPITKYCPSCPEGVSKLRAFVNDPLIYRATPHGIVPERLAGPQLRALLADVAQGTFKFFEASEPLGTLAELTPPGQRTLRGVALDDTITVARVLDTIGLDEVPGPSERITGGGTPALLGNEGAVLSGLARRMFVIGGTVDGGKHGVPNGSGWMLEVDVNEWQEFPLLEAQRPGAVLGAGYRWQDANVYLVDGKKTRPRLERWRPGGPVEVLLTLPHAWKKYDTSWLVSGESGDLVFAATKASGGGKSKTLLARFTVGSEGTVALAGVAYRSEPLLAAPIAGNEKVTLVVPHPSGGTLVSLAHDAFAVVRGEPLPLAGDDAGPEPSDDD